MSFDANARYLAKGRRFFAEVHEADPRLRLLGVKAGDVLACHMLNSTHNDCLIDVYVGDKVVTLSGYGDNSFLEYAGNINGNDFICDKVKARAKFTLDWEVL